MSLNADVPDRPASTFARWRRVLPLAVLLAASALAIALGGHRYLSLTALVEHHAGLAAAVADRPAQSAAAFVLAYAGIVALSLPGGVVMTLLGGLLFGWLAGAVTSAAGATLGATVVFLLARTSFGDVLARRAGGAVAKLAAGFRRHAFSYLLFLRLVPAFPFWLVNLVPALAGVRLPTYILATLVGIVPGTVVFAVIGSGLSATLEAQRMALAECTARGEGSCQVTLSIADLLTPELLAGLAALGVLALLPTLIQGWRRRRGGGDAAPDA